MFHGKTMAEVVACGAENLQAGENEGIVIAFQRANGTPTWTMGLLVGQVERLDGAVLADPNSWSLACHSHSTCNTESENCHFCFER